MSFPEKGELIQTSFPKTTDEVRSSLRNGEAVVVKYGSWLEYYLSEIDDVLPPGRIIFKRDEEGPSEGVLYEANQEMLQAPTEELRKTA